MSLGTPLIINKSSIDDNIRHKLIQHKFFNSRHFEDQTRFIDKPYNEFDLTILEFLKMEQYNHTGKRIEYWFQSHKDQGSLGAHCDYNYPWREKMSIEGDDWPHKVDKKHIVSPITIAVYLEVEDLIGGDLCISERTWMEEPFPAAAPVTIEDYPYERVTPEQGKVIYFKGSEHYHWIDPISSGTRKSLLINFWPID